MDRDTTTDPAEQVGRYVGPLQRVRRLLFGLAVTFVPISAASLPLLSPKRGWPLWLGLGAIAVLGASWWKIYRRQGYSWIETVTEPILLAIVAVASDDPIRVVGLFMGSIAFGSLDGSRRRAVLHVITVMPAYGAGLLAASTGNDGGAVGMSFMALAFFPSTASVSHLIGETLGYWETREHQARTLARLSELLIAGPDRESMINALLTVSIDITEGQASGALAATLSNGRFVVSGATAAYPQALGRVIKWVDVPKDVREGLASGKAAQIAIDGAWSEVLGLPNSALGTEVIVEPMRASNTLIGALGVFLDKPPPDGFAESFRELATQGALALAAEAESSRFQSLVEGSADLVAVTGLDGILTYVSSAAERLLGYSVDSIIGSALTDLVHPEDLRSVTPRIAALAGKPGADLQLELRALHADGTWRQFAVSLRNLVDVPAVAGIVVNARDVTDRHELEYLLAHQALHDELTGLPNRALLRDRLAHALQRAQRSAGKVAALHIDLDGFRIVNENLGRDAGDELIVEMSRRLRSAIRPGDTVARLGGDEFSVLLDPASHEQVVTIASRITASLQRPISLQGSLVAISGSVGVALATGDVDPSALLRDADIAMLAAKAAGKRQWTLFHETMHKSATERFLLAGGLQGALERNEFRVHYQPIVDLRTGKITSVEALLRWAHPSRGLVSPADFIPIAEETGLILPIGSWVLEEACRQVKKWQETLGPELSVHVNLSALQLDAPDLVDVVAETLRTTGLSSDCLVLELTESMAVGGSDVLLARMRAIRKLGVRFSLDDFGTGYSSLSYLQRLPVDSLKIDKSFVDQIGTHPAILEAIIHLARSLDLETVAEGVEQAQQATGLAHLGCDRAQGYFFARPAAPDELLNLLTHVGSEGQSAGVRAALSLGAKHAGGSAELPTMPAPFL